MPATSPPIVICKDSTRRFGKFTAVEIALSTLHRPKLLFLDEPTVGLDPIAHDAVWKHLLALQVTNGTTIIFTTHY